MCFSFQRVEGGCAERELDSLDKTIDFVFSQNGIYCAWQLFIDKK